MSTCPEQDMHSVYLDGELPQKYALDYESHLTNCQKCRDEYAKLNKLSSLLKEDASSNELSSQELEDSFSRLQTKLRYQQHIRQSQPVNVHRFTWVIPSVAAAALAFALILPNKGVSAPTQVTERPISISASALAGGLSVAPSVNTNQTRFIREPAIIVEEPIGHHIKSISLTPEEALSTMDIFRPSFSKDKKISLKMSLSDLESLPINGEISLPVQMYITISGN